MRITKKIASLAVISLSAFVVFAAAPVHAETAFGKESAVRVHPSNKGWCASFNVPVAPAQGQPHNWKVAATYCQPFKWAKGQRQVDVLTHGATYTNTYWDWPQNPGLYSYVGKTLA